MYSTLWITFFVALVLSFLVSMNFFDHGFVAYKSPIATIINAIICVHYDEKSEEKINQFYETIKQELKAYYEERYNFLNSFSNAELKSLKTISYLSKPKRRAVFEYACKLFKKEI